MLNKSGIVPENLPAAEDVKKLQRKLVGHEKKFRRVPSRKNKLWKN